MQANANRMQMSSMMSRSSSMNGPNNVNFQMQSLLQMGKQMEQNNEFFAGNAQPNGQQGTGANL